MFSLTVAAAAQAAGAGAPGLEGRQDIHSYARPQEVALEHLVLDLAVDFATQTMSGSATWTLVNHSGADTLWLDSNGLTIERATLDDGSTTTVVAAPAEPIFGQSLAVAIKPETNRVTLHYRTSPNAEAVQWLAASQTAGGKQPFLFTQSQAILARSWVPCQDTPSVRFTYEATIRVPPALLAVMSAENTPTRNADGLYRFRMPQRIPSYLLALAVGDLEFRALDERSGVYAEPSVVGKAAAEFTDLPEMIDATEALYGPYRWGRYDVLVLPPSFPFGGMENPRLTFATPTILAGDRSLVSLIAHELAHSWSGNLVTNAKWNDFWLNEGFTVYLERRIMEAISGRPYAEMLSSLALGELSATVVDMGRDNPDTRLRLDLSGRNPDDGLTDIAYEKGYFFLRLIEETVGRDAFDPFLRSWFDEHAFRSVTADDFLMFLATRLLRDDQALMDKLRISAWVDGQGLPSNLPTPISDRFAAVDTTVAAWNTGKTAKELAPATTSWSTHEWLRFLRALPAQVTVDRLADLDRNFGFTHSGNSEIACAWYLIAIANRYEAAYPAIENFLVEVGRRKFLKPLYEAMAKDETLLANAKRIYAKARPGYHAVARGTIDGILSWSN